jgi:hypothetical protein
MVVSGFVKDAQSSPPGVPGSRGGVYIDGEEGVLAQAPENKGGFENEDEDEDAREEDVVPASWQAGSGSPYLVATWADAR